MTGNDPTDQALAVIASIFEKPAPKPDAKANDVGVPDARARDELSEPTEASEHPRADADAETPATDASAHEILPDDVALVRIERQIVEIAVAPPSDAPEPNAVVADNGPEDLDALTRHGPGPLEALRFKWSVRRDGDGYYVDETIGTTSHPITTGPLSRAEAISFIETREGRARRRYERLRNEIVSGPSERGVEDDDSEL